ncbi:hypothetical protein H6G36_01820 [Anabaena minutissima FACHB-250]|nr:hypothetical protein [Anabaena minutissima FACHB-250]
MGRESNADISPSSSEYLRLWCDAEAKVRENVDATFAQMGELVECKAAWLISQILPPGTPLFIFNSIAE